VRLKPTTTPYAVTLKPNSSPSKRKWRRRKSRSTATSSITKTENSTEASSRHESRKLSGELTDLRHRRDGLLFELDNTPNKITKDELGRLGEMIAKLVGVGSGPQQKALCEAALGKIDINTKASTATPIFLIDIADDIQALNDESAPTENSVGALSACSGGVRVRTPLVHRMWHNANRIHAGQRPYTGRITPIFYLVNSPFPGVGVLARCSSIR
jgi:hypothetical protein